MPLLLALSAVTRRSTCSVYDVARIAVGAMFSLSFAVPLHAQERAKAAVVRPNAPAPLRVSSRCTIADPGDVMELGMVRAEGINESGVVAAKTLRSPAGPQHAAIWTSEGGVQDIDPTHTHESEADDVSDSGVVVGECLVDAWQRGDFKVAGEPRVPFRWSPALGFEKLPLPDGAKSAWVLGIDRNDNILIRYDTGSAVWSAETRTYVELPGIGGKVAAERMNEAGDVAGAVFDSDRTQKAAVWRRGSHELTVLPTPVRSNGRTVQLPGAHSVNQRGTVVGGATIDGQYRAVAWVGPDHAFRELGDGCALAVNDHDLAVGSPPTSVMTGVLVLWDVASLEEIRLPILQHPSYMYYANDVNNAGTPVGIRYAGGTDNPAIRFPQVVCVDS